MVRVATNLKKNVVCAAFYNLTNTYVYSTRYILEHDEPHSILCTVGSQYLASTVFCFFFFVFFIPRPALLYASIGSQKLMTKN